MKRLCLKEEPNRLFASSAPTQAHFDSAASDYFPSVMGFWNLKRRQRRRPTEKRNTSSAVLSVLDEGRLIAARPNNVNVVVRFVVVL